MREQTKYTEPEHALALAIHYLNRQPCLGQLEFDIEDAIKTLRGILDREAEYLRMKAENERILALINHPHTAEFLEAVKLEAVHQCERWGVKKDTEKTDAEWFWLVGYLAGKAMHSGDTDPEKRLHHIITTAASLFNWHAHRSGAR